MIFNELSLNPISNASDKYIIITFSVVGNPQTCHQYMFITETYSSKFFAIMTFWHTASEYPAENVPKKPTANQASSN